MKKLLLVGLTCFSTSVLASAQVSSDTQIKMEGLFNFQSGFVSQKDLTSKDKNVSGNRKNFGLFSEATLAATLKHSIDQLVYGGKIVLTPTAKARTSAGLNGSHIFVESEYGKMEIGSPHDAGSKLRVNGDNISVGGNWSRYSKLDNANMKYKGLAPEIVDFQEYFVDSVFRTKLDQYNDRAEPSRKISFFTPKMKGFQFGISYIPDSGNTGGASLGAVSSGLQVSKIDGTDNSIDINRNVKDAVSGGLAYEYNISDGVDVKFAATGEYGKCAGSLKIVENKDKDNEKVLSQHKLSDLKTYNIGSLLTYGSMSYGVSYGSLNKSLTNKVYNKTGRDTHYYTGAVAYGQGPIKVSLAYFKSHQFKNILDSVNIGTEYSFVPGFTPYAEIAYFQAKGRPSFYPEAPKKKTKGTIAVLGAKLKF